MITQQSKLVIADDHALMRMALNDLVRNFLPEENIIQIESPDTIIDTVKSDPAITTILLDLFMPGQDAFVLISKLLSFNSKLMIVIISASEKKQHIRKALELGAKGYIPKSSDMNTIKNALAKIFTGESYIPSIEEFEEETFDESYVLENTKAFKPEQIESLLTDRQLQIFQLLGQGKSNKEIASRMYISINTVKIHVSAILSSLQLENRAQAGIISRSLYH